MSQGDEQAACLQTVIANHTDSWNADGVPDPQDEATFRRSQLDWTEMARPPHRALLDWHRALIALRRASPELLDGRREAVRVQFDERAQWLVVERGPFRIAANLAAEPQAVPLAPASYELVLRSADGARLGGDAIALGQESVAVLRAG